MWKSSLVERFWPLWERWVLRGGYSPQRYWEHRGRFFFFERYQQGIYWQHVWLATQLKKRSWNSLLEIGSGFGRNLRFLHQQFPDKEFAGIELTETLVEKSKEFLKGTAILTQAGDIRSLPARSSKPDVVLTHGVLMHLEPKDCQKAIDEMIKTTKDFIVCIEQIQPPLSEEVPHAPINTFTFSHNLPVLFKRKSWTLSEKEERQSLGAYVFTRT